MDFESCEGVDPCIVISISFSSEVLFTDFHSLLMSECEAPSTVQAAAVLHLANRTHYR